MKRLLAVAGLALVPFAAAAASFPDVPAAYESSRAIDYLQAAGVLQGYADGRFRPAFPINRAEFLKVLVAGKGLSPDAAIFSSCFPDVAREWFAPYVCYATGQGWVQGYPDGMFRPEQPVSFAEALKMLVNVRGYPPAPAEDVLHRGLDPAVWFSSYLTTALLIDVVSYEQVWGDHAVPLQSSLDRGFVAQLLYRSIMAEGGLSMPLDLSGCASFPTVLEIKTYVDVVLPAKTNVFRQEFRGLDASGASCLLAADANPFGRVTHAFDDLFLRPFPGVQAAGSWTATGSLANGRLALRAGTADGALRPELFVIDPLKASMRQLPSVFASPAGAMVSYDGRYLAYVGATGRSLEAIDLDTGNHTFLDVLDGSLTLFRGPDGGQDATASPTANVVQYAVYDSSKTQDGGYAFVDTRFADIDLAFGQTPFPAFPSFDDPFPANP